MPYAIDYAGAAPAQRHDQPLEERNELSLPGDRRDAAPYRAPRRFGIPNIVKTGATFLTGAAVFFGAEGYAPPAFRPSTLMGTYESRVQTSVQTAVKAAELTQQARYEAWAANVKVSVEQQAEQYKAVNQGILARYQATFDRGKIFAEAATRLQGQYVAARLAQTQATQGTDITIINWARAIGRAENALEPGSGDGTLAYSDSLAQELATELTDAATKGVTVSVEGWDSGLASIDDLKRDLDAVKPIAIPAPPRLGGEGTTRTPASVAR